MGFLAEKALKLMMGDIQITDGQTEKSDAQKTLGTGNIVDVELFPEREEKAPLNIMTDKLKSELKAHKQELIEELRLQLPRPTICPSCNGADWWLSIYDKWICTECHPPANERLVKRKKTLAWQR